MFDPLQPCSRPFRRLMSMTSLTLFDSCPTSSQSPMPMPVLKQVVHLVAPYCSLDAGHFPSGYRESFITPFVKKAGRELDGRFSNASLTDRLFLLICSLLSDSTSFESCRSRRSSPRLNGILQPRPPTTTAARIQRNVSL